MLGAVEVPSNIDREALRPLHEIASLLGVSRNTITYWHDEGLSGVRLEEPVWHGGRAMTSLAAIDRLFTGVREVKRARREAKRAARSANRTTTSV